MRQAPLWAVCALLASVPALAGAHDEAGVAVASRTVTEWAKQAGMAVHPESPERVRLEREGNRVVLVRDQREALLNGIRVHLGWPVGGNNGVLRISESDWRHQLAPLLTPEAFLPAPPPARHILLDPGHGGHDRGAENPDLGLLEKDFNLDLARRLRARLVAAGHTVSLTREEDAFIPLAERAPLAAARGADLFVSLHGNALPDARVRGVETYAFTPQMQPSTGRARLEPMDQQAWPGNRNDPWNTLLGYHVQQSLVQALGVPDRGLKRARFRVLRDLDVPGILVEAGYLTHPEEARELADPDRREEIARAIADGIAAWNHELERLRARH